MANCGRCGSTKICNCIFIDTSTVDVQGDGSPANPFVPYIQGYPNPRPHAIISGSPFILTASENTLSASVGHNSIAGMWNGSSRIIAPSAGTYLVTLNTYSNVVTFLVSKLRVNGSTIIASRMNYFTILTPSGRTASGTLTSVYRFSVNDYIEVLSWNAAGGGSVQTFFTLEMRWMGL